MSEPVFDQLVMPVIVALILVIASLIGTHLIKRNRDKHDE